MTKSETTILESKDPAAYIDSSLKSRLSPAAKARLARLWMEKTGYSKEDILRARNRHPYWRKKKMEGSVERTRRRLAAHDYSGGAEVEWTRARIEEFLSLNGKGRDGRYEMKDWQLAEHFGSSIPSIQYMRRKCRKVESLIGARASRAKTLDYLMRAESVLKRGAGAVEALAASEKERAKAALKAPAKAGAKAKPAAKAKPKAAAKGGASAKNPAAKVAPKKSAPKKAASMAPAKKAVRGAARKPAKK